MKVKTIPWNKGQKTSKLKAQTFRLEPDTNKKITHLTKRLKISKAKVVKVSVDLKYETINRQTNL